MQQLAAAIRKNIDRLLDQYDAHLGQVPGYNRMPAAMRRELELNVLNLVARCLEDADYTPLVQYVQERAAQWAAQGLNLTWFQQAVQVAEVILTPLIDSVEAGNFLWPAFNRSQNVVWQMVAEQAQHTEERFRAIVETSHSGVMIIDNAFQLAYVNDELVQISGYSREELLGADFRRLLDEDSRQAVAENYVRRQRGEDVPTHYDVGFLRKDGAKRYIELSAVALKDLNGNPYTVAQVLDVTERKHVEAALTQERNLLHTLIDSLPDQIFFKDAEGRVILNNQADARAMGVASPAEAIGKSVFECFPPELAECYHADDMAVIRSGQAIYDREEPGADEAGQARWIQTTKVPLTDEHGQPIGLVGFAHDVTQRRRLEQEVRGSLDRRSVQVQTSVEVAQHIAAAPEVGELLHRVVTLVKERFNYYHAQLFRYVPAEDAVVLVTGYGEVGQKMLAAGHKLAMGRGVVGTAAATGRSILASDVAHDPDWRPNPNLPDTKGELAVPIRLGTGDAESQGHALKHFLNNGYDGVAVTAIDTEAVAHLATDFLQHGKPVVTITSDLGPGHQTTLVAAVEHEMGYLLGVQAGRWAEQHVPAGQAVKIGVLTYRALENVVERERGIIDGVRSVISERAVIVANQSALEQKEATYLAEGWLRDNPDLSLILAYNDATALGAYQAAQSMGWHDSDKFFIGGIDAVPEALTAIRQNSIYQATVNQPPEVMGLMAVRTLVAAAKGLPVKQATTLYCAPVNRSNVAEFSGPAREAAILAHQDIIPAEALSSLDLSGLRLGLSVLTLANPFFAALAESAQKEARRLGVQLTVNDPSQILGVLDVQSDQANMLTEDDRLLLEGLCGQIAIAIESKRLVDAAQQSERLMRAIIEAVPDNLYVKNRQNQFILANKSVLKQLGCQTLEQLVGKTDLDFYPPEMAQKFLRDEQQLFASGEPLINMEEPSLDAQGAPAWRLSTKVFFHNEAGEIAGLVGLGRDITEFKRIEEALRRNEAQLSEALKAAQLAYWEYDVASDTFTFNDQFYALLRTTAEREGGYTMKSMDYAQRFVHPEDAPLVGQEVQHAIESSDPHFSRELDHRIFYADGQPGYVTVRFRIQKDAQGRTVKTFGANQDITERKQAEQALALEQSLMHALMDSVTDHIYFKDLQSRFLRISKSQAERFGFSDPAEAVGKSDFDIFTEDHARPAYEDEQKIIQTGHPIMKEERETWTDQPDSWVLTTKFPLRDETEQIVGTFGVSVDITERKLVEFERERLLVDQQRRALQLQTASEVARATSSMLELGTLLPQAAELIRERFNLYYVGLFLTNNDQRWAVLRSGTGQAGQQMLANGHKLKIGGNSMISRCIETQQAQIALDVGEEAVRFDNPLLPLTRSELALPLISRGDVIGAMTIQSDEPSAFTPDDITALQSMANQIGNAVENAILYEQTQTALREVDAINRRLTGEAWDNYLQQQAGRDVIWLADDNAAAPTALPHAEEALTAGEITVEPDSDDSSEATVTAPILLRGQLIGALRLRTRLDEWDEDSAAMLSDIAGHIAQAAENARLVEQTQRTAQRERMINEINARVRQSVDLDAILRTAVNELGQSLKAARVMARLGTTTAEGVTTAGDGRGKTND